MADQIGGVSPAAAGQQGLAVSPRASQELNDARDAKLNKSSDRKPAKGKQAVKRGGKEDAARGAEVGRRGVGSVKLLREGFGFISCPEMNEQLFFHASEVLPPEGQEGPPLAFKDALAVGNRVEFVVGQNTGKRSNHVAKQVRRVAFDPDLEPIEKRFRGKITREVNSGQWRSEDSSTGQISYRPDEAKEGEEVVDFHAADVGQLRRRLTKGTTVEFLIITDLDGQQRALQIELWTPPKPAPEASTNVPSAVLHGFVKSVNAKTGLIRCIEREERFPFKRADVAPHHQDKLQAGAEVLFSIAADARPGQRGSNPSAVGLAVLPAGSLTAERVSEGVLKGRIIRPASPADAERAEPGLIATHDSTEAWLPNQLPFRAGQLEGSKEGAESLTIGDEVEFEAVTDFRTDTIGVRNLCLTGRASEQRELGQIRTLKDKFGFIRCCQRTADLFFHFTTLRGCSKEALQKNDDVEFTVERNPEHGTIAVRVRKMPPGSAVFETISEELYNGIVVCPLQQISPQAVTNGVLSFREDDQPAKIMFGQHDIKEKVSIGDHVTFRIANNINAARQAEKLGATISQLIGRRATQGSLLKLKGTVRQTKGSYGFVRYTSAEGTEKSVFFHCSEVRDGLALRPGDEVNFCLSDNPKSGELNARRIVRTQEAPPMPPAAEPEAPTREERPTQPPKLAAGNAALWVPNVKMPAMPDGTRGFTLGRGTPLKPPYPALLKPSAPVEIPARKTSAEKRRAAARNEGGATTPRSISPLEAGTAAKSLGKTHSRSLPSITKLGRDLSRDMRLKDDEAVNQPNSLLRSSSGLNPAAPTFMPKFSNG